MIKQGFASCSVFESSEFRNNRINHLSEPVSFMKSKTMNINPLEMRHVIIDYARIKITRKFGVALL